MKEASNVTENVMSSEALPLWTAGDGERTKREEGCHTPRMLQAGEWPLRLVQNHKCVFPSVKTAGWPEGRDGLRAEQWPRRVASPF